MEREGDVFPQMNPRGRFQHHPFCEFPRPASSTSCVMRIPTSGVKSKATFCHLDFQAVFRYSIALAFRLDVVCLGEHSGLYS